LEYKINILNLLNEHNAELGLKPLVVEQPPEPIETINEEDQEAIE
jgi:hypothetical protein